MITNERLIAALNAHDATERKLNNMPEMLGAWSLDQWGRNTVETMRAALAASDEAQTLCRCAVTSENRGGGYYELMLEPEPCCPQHGDPAARQGPVDGSNTAEAVEVVARVLANANAIISDPAAHRDDAAAVVAALQLTRPNVRIAPKHSPAGMIDESTYSGGGQWRCLGCSKVGRTEGEMVAHIAAADAIAAGPLTRAEFDSLPVGSIVTVKERWHGEQAAILGDTNDGPRWWTTLDAPSANGDGYTGATLWEIYGDDPDEPGVRLVRHGGGAAKDD